MAQISRRDLILFTIAIDKDGVVGDAVNGITRLQKYLYLLEKDFSLAPRGDGFEFEPYKAGPFSRRVYDDLEFLENLGLIESEVAAEATPEEKVEVDSLTFEDLIGGGSSSEEENSDGEKSADAYEERRYRLTGKGLVRIRELVDSRAYEPFSQGIRKLKAKFASISLSDLIYYVYTKYPESATESEIRDRILSRRYRL